MSKTVSASTSTHTRSFWSSDVKGYVKPVIACDCDEVLARFVLGILQFHNQTYHTDLKFEDFFSYDFSKVWGGTPEQTFTKLEEFFDSHHFENLPPLEEAADVLRRLSHKFDLYVVTARQNILEDSTRQWIERHFPGVFKDILFGNHYARKGNIVTKAALCRSINAVALIDDYPDYIREVAPNVRIAILFNENDTYGWSKGVETQHLPSNCLKCVSWENVEKELNLLYDSLLKERTSGNSRIQ